MVEDVIGIDACHTDRCSIKRHSLEKSSPAVITKLHIADLVVTARTTIIEVDTHLRGIDAEIELFFQPAFRKADVLDVEGIAEENPAPSEIGTHLGLAVR